LARYAADMAEGLSRHTAGGPFSWWLGTAAPVFKGIQISSAMSAAARSAPSGSTGR
jgi:hypothetical protein